MHVAFSRQAFGGGCELDFIRAADHDAVARFDAALQPDCVAVARGDLDVATRESLAADLDPHIRPARLE